MEPTETLAVTFFEQPCLAVRSADGTIYVSIRDLCEAVGLARPSQVRRLRADEDLRDGMQVFRVPTAGGVQDQEFLILEFVPTWMTSINRARATPIVRERLRFLRLFAIREVYNAFAQVAGLPPGDSRAIEDLADLTRFDDAMTELASRQQAIEESQDRARSAWRDLDGRVRALEDKLGSDTISATQRGYIYQLVQHWAQARLEQEPTLSRTAAFAGCWAALKTRYRIAKYEHLPAHPIHGLRPVYPHRLPALDRQRTRPTGARHAGPGVVPMSVHHQQSRQVGQRIAHLRHRQRLSTRELAERLGWPRDTLVNFEHGRRAITIERLEAIAQALDVAPAALLLEDDRLRDLLARIRAEPSLVDQIAFFLATLDDELLGASQPS